jgi:pilus assembly protein Flp/PilA
VNSLLNYFTSLLLKLSSPAREEGQTMVEYALLVAFIALVALVAVKVLGSSISSLFNSVATNL